MKGTLYIIGIGPGSKDQLSGAAMEGLKKSDTVIGFSLYIALIRDTFPDKKFIINGMQGELARARKAIELAMQGETVSLISSGDAGIYGIASPVFEIIEKEKIDLKPVVVPGISALSSAASLLGAPLSNDFMVVSMSDLLTDFGVILKRVEAAAFLDMVTVIYNPRGSRFPDNLQACIDIFRKHRSPETPVGLVKKAYRRDQQITIATLGEMDCEMADMVTTVIIGNSETRTFRDMIYTKRGYSKKYDVSQ